jgi:hypothetical protein
MKCEGPGAIPGLLLFCAMTDRRKLFLAAVFGTFRGITAAGYDRAELQHQEKKDSRNWKRLTASGDLCDRAEQWITGG